jgi:hypothetical protein
VTTTDLPSCIPNLTANVAANGRPEGGGSIRVLPYAWGDDITPIMREGGYHYVVGTDVAYSEVLIPTLLSSCAAIAAASQGLPVAEGVGSITGGAPAVTVKKCTVILANELRCERAHATFLVESERHFTGKQVPQRRLHPETRHMNLQLFELRLRGAAADAAGQADAEAAATGSA